MTAPARVLDVGYRLGEISSDVRDELLDEPGSHERQERALGEALEYLEIDMGK